MFNGSVDPSDLQIEVVEGLTVSGEAANGAYSGNGVIQVNKALYDLAGVDENSTVENTDVLAPAVINALSTLVHEATHHWQNKYGPSYNNDLSNYFSLYDLIFLELGVEQQAGGRSSLLYPRMATWTWRRNDKHQRLPQYY